MLELLNAPPESRCVFLTTSGTGAMESCVINILNDTDKVIIINGGSFGQRFVELCKLHERNFTEVKCEFGKALKREQLMGLEDHTALLVNMHETSSGVLYDMQAISDFCKNNNILLIIDAISSFISDELDMSMLSAATVITGSQKALAVQPGISIIALAPNALVRIYSQKERCLYLSLREALKNGERGQTPFTPAVTILLQIHSRLKTILSSGGIEVERKRIATIAKHFRNSIKDLPFDIISENCSNAVTAIHPRNVNASQIINILKEEYKIWVCPNGGEYANSVFRVGHIGHITEHDLQHLIDALHDMLLRGLL